MAARATSSGTISFGLVSIPVKVYPASSTKSVRFHMLHETDKARLRQQLVCTACDEVVDRKATVKGYEYAKNQYVVVEDEELKSLESQSDRSIEIEEFIPIEQVDPVFFDRANLLGPDKGGAKPYRLLREAMEASGKVAIGRYATRGKQQLVLIRPVEEGLVLHGLLYADEVRRFEDIDLGDAMEFKKGEMDLALQLIEQLSERAFEPEKYEDGYRQAVLEMIERKVAGEEIVVAPAAESKEQIIDLVAALKQSLASKADGAEEADEGKGRVRKAAKKASARKKAARRKSASG